MRDLEQRIKDLKSGKTKTIPWNTVKKELKRRMKKWDAAAAERKQEPSKGR
jgi:hypothetical protein